MINHNAIFRDQLKRISSAINKKHVTLRKQIIKTLEVFENSQLPVFPYEVCFGLFRHIIDASSITSSLIFFPFIQNIINLGFASEQMSKQIISLLTHIKSIPKFSSQQNSSKLQTIIMLLVGKHAVNLKNLSYTHNIINILFSMENSKSKTLWMKTVSTLDQIMLLFINQLSESISEEKLYIFNSFLSDLLKIARRQQPKWLTQLPQPFIAMTLISDTLDQKYIREHFQHHKLIFDTFLPSLKKSIQKFSTSLIIDYRNHHHYQLSSRQLSSRHQKVWELTSQNQLILMMRVSLKLSKLVMGNFQVLEEIIKIISQKGVSSVKYIGYESINYLFTSPNWMQVMLNSPSGDLFHFLLTTLFNNAKFILSQYRDKIDMNIQYEVQKWGKLFMGSFVDFTPFELLPVIQLKLIIKNIEEITFSLYSIYNQIYGISMQRQLSLPLQSHQQQLQSIIIPLQKTYKFCQKTVFEITKALIAKQMPQDVLQSLLKISQKFINLSGVFGDNLTSTSYMKLICKHCLPGQFGKIGHRHVQINKMILNTANCLGNLFSTGCWAIVWKALQNYSIYYNRYLLGKQQLQSQRKSDVQILYKSMDSIFTESSKYENDYLLKILRSLIQYKQQVTYECLENNFSQQNKKIFAFERIQQVYRLNLFRIPIIWPQLSSSLLCITTSKVLYFRLSAINLLNTLVPITLHYIKTHPEILDEKMTKQNHQLMILQPWVNLAGCQFQEIKNQLSLALNKVIIDYGHILENGWTSILQIVKKTRDIKSLQAIVQTYLDKISANIMQTINIIDQVERSLNDMNQKYLCLTMIWAIGDHCHKNQQHDALRKIYSILLQPQQMFVLGMQARHSSFYIFAEIIVHNCSQQEQTFWRWIFGEITNYYRYAMKKCVQRKQSTNCEQQLKNILTNLIKIYRRLFSVSKQFSTNDLVLTQLNNYFTLCSQMLQFRQSQVYQMILKQTKQIINMKTTQCVTREEFWRFLECLSQIYYVENDTKILKCLITYLPNEIYEIVGKTLGSELPEKLYVVYHLVEKVFLLRLEAQQKDIKLGQLRIFFQQKNFLQLFKKLHSQVMKIQHPTTQSQTTYLTLYLDYLIKTNHKLLLYQDFYYLHKFINFLSSLICKYSEYFELKDSIDFFRKIIQLKFDENWIKKHSSSKEIPVWYFATQQLIKHGYQYSALKLKAPYEMVYKIFMSMIQSDTDNFHNKQLLQYYSIDNLPLFYENHLQVLNFLTECYFLNANFSIQPITIENIISSVARQASYDQMDKTNKSKNSYELLFKLSAKRFQGKEREWSQKIMERQAIFVRNLFARILRSFDQYFTAFKLTQKNQQQRVLSALSASQLIHQPKLLQNQPQPQTQFQHIVPFQKAQLQIKFILKRFLSFQLQQNILQSENLSDFLTKNYLQQINPKCRVLKSEIAHLFYFNSSIAKCIRSENAQLRQIVSEIFQKMGNFVLLIQ